MLLRFNCSELLSIELMPVPLFKLRNVPDDEAEDVRNLLQNNHIDYYETPAGNWGMSMPAIWLNDEQQLEQAKSLIEEYQQQRLASTRKAYAQTSAHEKRQNFIRDLLANPIQTVMYVGFAALILYFSIKPFLDFGQ